MRNNARRLPVFALVLAVASLVFFSLPGCHDDSGKSFAPSAPSAAIQAANPGADNPEIMNAEEVQNLYTPSLMTLPDVIGTGIGMTADGHPSIYVFTRAKSWVPGVPTTLDGIPTHIEVVGEVVPLASYKGTYRPVPGGVSVGNDRECAAGTIGCTVIKSGVKYMLSNNHVFARVNAASIGERIDQPGRYDAHPACAQTGQVGTLSDFVRISFTQNNVVDAAIAAYTTTSTCAMVNNLYTPSSTIVSPSVGLAVKKVGRTSGLTHGTISAINVTISVSYGSPGTATFVNQIYVAGSFIRSGDSGSLMVTESGNNPVGLDFAGGSSSSFANPIGPVLQAFAATVCGN